MTERDVFEALLAGEELKLIIGKPVTEFGEYFKKKYNYKGSLSKKNMTKEMWALYNKEHYHWVKELQC